MRNLVRILVLVVLVVVVGGGSFAIWGLRAIKNAMGGDTAVVIEVQHGARLRTVLSQLGQAGVLNVPNTLYIYARLRQKAHVKSGTYSLNAKQTPLEILAVLLDGKVFMERFTIAEGLNRWQVRDLLATHQWIAPKQFDALCDDRAFLHKHKLVGPSCEGFLFPETYKIARGTTAEDVFAELFGAYKRQVARAMAQSRAPMPMTELQFVTLASIVEKETGAAEERPHIACAFYNRMLQKPPWKLETDPTVIYAATLLDPNFNGNLTRWHLHEMQSPYNTYRVVGLPPGPIANPGIGALMAVAQPLDCPDFFFVSRNHGLHTFCPTLACHLRAVKTWQVDYFRKARNKKGAATPLSTVPEARVTPRKKGHSHKNKTHRALQ